MTTPWQAEQLVDAQRAAALVGRQFPALRGAPVRAVATGWDNSVLLVGEVLFRFPRREVAVGLQRRELAVLPVVAPQVPLAVPAPTHVGEPDLDYPWPFWGAPMLPGDELALVDVPREAAAEAAGAFLRALHGLRVEVDLPVDPMGRGSPQARADLSRGWLSSLHERGLWQPSRAADELVGASPGAPPGPFVLVHGDLHPRHLLVDRAGRATGVIDWGDTCFAHPAVDLSLAWSAFDGRARAALLDAYGPVDADTELRARALALCLCAALAAWAADTGASRLLPEYLRGLQRAIT